MHTAPRELTVDRLAEYERMRRRVFEGKWVVERLIDQALRFPWLFDRAISRIGRREGMAHTIIGLAGGFVPTREVMNPVFLARMLV